MYEIGTNTRELCSFRKNSIIKISNSSQPLIEEKLNWRSANKQASEHPSGAKEGGGTVSKQCLTLERPTELLE